MQYYVDNGDIWYDHQQLAALPFCSSPPPPLAPPGGLAELADYCSSDLILSLISSCEEEEEETTRSAACYLPPPPMFPAADDLPPLPPTADDDALLLELEPFLESLGNDSELVDDNGVPPVVPVAVDQTTVQEPLQINGRHDDGDDDGLSVVVFTGGYETEKQQQQQQSCAFARPPAVEKKNKKRGDASGGRSLQHVGLEDLRKYFYMPITVAAQELKVGATALKKRCRELGVARWPHRKMKSLRSLISNLQEMGEGMKAAGNGNGNGAVSSSAAALGAVQLAELELCRAMMEENPAMELSESTKKLRQACFKENYKRRRVDAATTTVNNMLEHYPFSFSHHQQLLPQHLG